MEEFRPWTPEEISELHRIAAEQIPLDEAPVLPGRTLIAMRLKMKRMKIKYFFKHGKRATAWTKIKAVLADFPMDSDEIAEQTDMALRTISEQLALHRDEVHISDWIRTAGNRRGSFRRVWALGTGDDAPAPGLSEPQVMKRPEPEPKNEPDYEAIILQQKKEKLRKLEESGKLIRRDEFTSFLFGPARKVGNEQPVT